MKISRKDYFISGLIFIISVFLLQVFSRGLNEHIPFEVITFVLMFCILMLLCMVSYGSIFGVYLSDFYESR